MKKNIWTDDLILGEIVIIGLAEAAHLAAVVFGWSFQWCATVFWGTVGSVCVLLAGWLVFRCRSLAKSGRMLFVPKKAKHDSIVWILWMILAMLLISQLLFIWLGQGPYLKGDMTVETVRSFLEADQIYLWNPMTGQPYTEGIPSRLKILCLPTLYGCLCKILDLSPQTVVWIIMPTVTLLSSYAAFYALACCLFSVPGAAASGEADSMRRKRLCFLIAVSLLLWVGTYFHTMDGFQLLYCGWRGTAIRNGVLLPWLAALCIRRKWLSAILCVLAEACMAWTLYGMGVCLLVIMGMAVADGCTRERPAIGADSFWEADSEECTK